MIERTQRIVFMGTPSFAVPSLQILLDAGYPVSGVVTAPDKAGGRGMKQMIVSPIKSFALDHGLPVLQPVNLKSARFFDQLREWKADLQVVVAFRMLPQLVWGMPPRGTMNLHGSLLPAYRGAAPIQWSIVNGETMTGVTTFLLQHEIDTGGILQQVRTPILPEDNAGTLHDRMMHIGAGLVLGSVDLIQEGNFRLVPQDHAMASHAPKLSHNHGHIGWESECQDIQNQVRGLSPFPGAWSMMDGLECKILRTSIFSDAQTNKPGTLTIKDKKMLVQAKDGEIEILELQLAGKKRMEIRDFLNGYQPKAESLT